MKPLKFLFIPQFLSEVIDSSDQEKLFDFNYLSDILSSEDLAIYYWINTPGAISENICKKVGLTSEFTHAYKGETLIEFPDTEKINEMLGTIEARSQLDQTFTNFLLTEPADSIGIRYYGVCNDTLLISIVPYFGDEGLREELIAILEACNEYLRIPAEQLQLYSKLVVSK